MSRFSMATQLSIALALMTGSLLMIAHTFRLTPDAGAAMAQARAALTEVISLRIASALEAQDDELLIGVASRFVAAHEDVVSVGVRNGSGTLLGAAGPHASLWPEGAGAEPEAPHSRIPLVSGDETLAEVEICFREESAGVFAALSHPMAGLTLFCIGAGFLVYRIYLRRVLQYLDPAAVIPERVRQTLDALSESVLILDMQGRIVLCNQSWSRVVGKTPDVMMGRNASSFAWRGRGSVDHEEPAPWTLTIDDGELRTGVRLELAGDDGEAQALSVNCAPIAGPDGARRGALVTLTDLTELEAQKAELEDLVHTLAESRHEIAGKNEELQKLASTDPLTGCFNRRELFERAERHSADSSSTGEPVACIMFDIDYFKMINDTHGHQAGDNVLRAVSGILHACAREQDVVGRFGGEEFCIILPGSDERDAARVAERIRAAIAAEPIAGLSVTASLGVADNCGGGISIDDLCHNADRALYQAKEHGRNRVACFGDIGGNRINRNAAA